MPTQQELTAEIALVHSLKFLVQAYEELAIMKMQQIRNKVLNTRTYVEGLTEVFFDVHRSYRRQVEQLMKENKGKQGFSFSTLAKNGKGISVLISPNQRLSGTIAFSVFSAFLNHIKQSKDEVVIVGKVGKDMWEQRNLGKNFTYFEAPDEQAQAKDLEPIISKLMQYETVNVFHGKYQNLIRQDATISNVTGDDSLLKPKEDSEKRRMFLFEPMLKDVLHFFEVQITATLFQQTIHESHLAHLGSRITAMEEASGNIDNRLLTLKHDKLKIIKAINNKKQIQTYAGMSLWQCAR